LRKMLDFAKIIALKCEEDYVCTQLSAVVASSIK